MKQIGIKLADGTFYPILEEGEAKTQKLDLTTVKDNQTKVQIDVYRSESGSMDDAEYVDTLEVTKLNPHPNGEPDLHLSIGLDENNELTAEVIDGETGKKSGIQVQLVTRSLAERESSVPDFTVENAVNPAEVPPVDETDVPFSFDSVTDDPASESNPGAADIFDIPDFSDLQDDESLTPKHTPVSADFDLPDLGDFGTAEESAPAEEAVPAEPAPAEEPVAKEAVPAEEPAPEEAPAEDTVIAAPAPADDFGSLDLPDFGDFGEKDSSAASSISLDDFDLPDFGSSSGDLGSSFDDLLFSDTPSSSSSSSSGSAAPAAGPAMDFSDLYDKETLAGNASGYSDFDDETSHKTRVPVIICVVCAIICIIATALILFIIPSRYNLLSTRKAKQQQAVETPAEETKPAGVDALPQAEAAPAPQPLPEPEPEPEKVAPAVEDKIVVAPSPEEVVPEPVVVKEPAPEPKKKSADVTYRIKWGDTLWDISDAYYKNPWRYPKIASYNHIPNPDLIISGTDIIIPADQ